MRNFVILKGPVLCESQNRSIAADVFVHIVMYIQVTYYKKKKKSRMGTWFYRSVLDLM